MKNTLRKIAALAAVIITLAFSACSFSDGDALEALYSGGSSTYLATVSGGGSYISNDGLVWASVTGPTATVSNAVYAEGKIFATANNTPNDCLHYSYDLLNWKKVPGTAYPFTYVIYGDGVLVTGDDVGDIRYTTDIYNESLVLQSGGSAGGNPFEGGVYGDGVYIFVESNAIHASRDGMNWDFNVDSDAVGHGLHAVTYGRDLYVAVGNKGGNAGILVSNNGYDWTDVSPGFTDELNDVAYGNGMFVAVGGAPAISSYVTVSNDGFIWSPKIQLPHAGANALRCVTYGNREFLAGAEGNGIILNSEDGLIWYNTGPGGFIGFTDILYIP